MKSKPKANRLDALTVKDSLCYCFQHETHLSGGIMPSLKQIESEVAALPESELRQFRSWLDEFDAQNWDRSLAADINNGKLDSLAAEAIAQHGGCQYKKR